MGRTLAGLTMAFELSDNIQMTATLLKLNVARLPSVNRAEEVARELRNQIRLGALSPQVRLPSEHMMATQFGVSRAVIREAVARLRSEGLVKTRQGSGAYVRDNDITSLNLDPDIRKSLESVLAIVELRKGIEAEAAALAAERRTRRDLVAIEKALAQIAEITREGGDSSKADILFHRAIAEAAHNPYYIAVLDYLNQFVLTAIRASRRNAALPASFTRQIEVEHHSIVAAIRRRDSSSARLAAQIHMDQARLRIRQAGRECWPTDEQATASN
jgi:GntR family transcriptional regulator, transcriptional repressor for pyruvate dehydrogenase complex